MSAFPRYFGDASSIHGYYRLDAADQVVRVEHDGTTVQSEKLNTAFPLSYCLYQVANAQWQEYPKPKSTRLTEYKKKAQK
jgi:hypothetical protein